MLLPTADDDHFWDDDYYSCDDLHHGAGTDVSLLLEVYQYVCGHASVYRRYGSLQWMLSGSIS